MIEELKTKGRQFLEPVEEDEAEEAPAKKARKQVDPVRIDFTTFTRKSKDDRIVMILSAYKAQAKMVGAPIQSFGEPNAWLNNQNFHEFHEEVIAMAKTAGIAFLTPAGRQSDEEEVPMHE